MTDSRTEAESESLYIDYTISGSFQQNLMLRMPSGAEILAEPGVMVFRDEAIAEPEGRLDGFEDRLLSGESIRQIVYRNASDAEAQICLRPQNGMRHIAEADISHDLPIYYRQGNFMASTDIVRLSARQPLKLRSTLMGMKGIFMQAASPLCDGPVKVFLGAVGDVNCYEMKKGQVIDARSLLAYQTSDGTKLDFDLAGAEGLKDKFLRSEGRYAMRLRGDAKIWLETLPSADIVNTNPFMRISASGIGALLFITLISSQTVFAPYIQKLFSQPFGDKMCIEYGFFTCLNDATLFDAYTREYFEGQERVRSQNMPGNPSQDDAVTPEKQVRPDDQPDFDM